MWFAFTWIHGIRAEDVREAPEFPQVFEEFGAELNGALLLAHNAGFDAGVMRGCSRAYGIRSPRLSYLCTLWVARNVWPELPSKGLASIASFLGLKFRHHNAAEDARACAEVALAAARIVGALEVVDIPDRLQVWRAGMRAVA